MNCLPAILLLLMTTSSVAPATAPADAADLYREAANSKMLPRAETEAERRVLIDVLDAPLNETMLAILERGRPSLALFDKAADMPDPDWQIDLSDWRDVKKLTLLRGDDLADLVYLRIRINAHNNDVAAAMEDCIKLMTYARRLGQPATLSSQLQQRVVEAKAVRAAALLLPQLEEDQTVRLLERLESVSPPSPDPAEVIANEKSAFLYVHRQLLEDEELREMADRWTEMINEMFSANAASVSYDDLTGDPEARERVLKETGELFDDMVRLLRLPDEQRGASWQDLSERVKEMHPLLHSAHSTAVMAMHLRKSSELELDMLRMAVAVQRQRRRLAGGGGPNEIAAPYEYSETNGGFELRLKLPGERAPYILRVGEPATRPANVPSRH